MPLLGIYLEKTKTRIQKDKCTHMFIAALFVIAETWKQPKCPSADEWPKRYIHNRILLSRKTEWNIAIHNNMDGPREYGTKWSESTEKNKYYILAVVCGLFKKKKWCKWVFLQNRNRLTDTESKLIVTKGKIRDLERGGIRSMELKDIHY